MNDELNLRSQNYQPDSDPKDSRFLDAKREWDRRLGTFVIQSYNWRLMSFGLVILCILLGSGLIYQSNKSTVKPYVVEVDTKNGMVRAVGMAEQKVYTPNEMVIKFFLKEFVEASRSISSDNETTKKNWEWVYSFLTKNTSDQMSEYINKDASKLRGKVVRVVNVKVVVPASKNMWQVRWEEISKDPADGKILETQNMTGNFVIDLKPPTDEKQVFSNPIGLFVKEYSWSKESM